MCRSCRRQEFTKTNKLTTWIMVAMVLGVVAGYICNINAPDAKAAKEIAGYFSIATDVFLRLIKMVIAPLVFATLVGGIASMGDSSAVGRMGAKAMGWFISATTNLQTSTLNLKDFVTHVFPRSVFEAMAQNEVLQILVFSLFFGFAIASFKGRAGQHLIGPIEDLGKMMLRVTDFVMRFAPLGVFGAVAAAITVQGIGVLVTYGRFIGEFYVALLVLWVALIGAGYLFLGARVFTLLKLVGSMMYSAFASLFIAQAYNIQLSLTEQITMLLVLMITSKGIAGVPRASVVVVAAVLPMFKLPEAGVLLILGIDQFLDMGRTATNVIGNSIATAVVTKSEGLLGATRDVDEDDMLEPPEENALAN
ncbi:dicarboxylate/amino acid:cation symporter [Paraburkholderia sediminicola]